MKDTFVICTDLGNGLTTWSAYGYSVDVSAEVKRMRAFEKKLLKRYLQKKRQRARK